MLSDERYVVVEHNYDDELSIVGQPSHDSVREI
jgi:hypothetical protein